MKQKRFISFILAAVMLLAAHGTVLAEEDASAPVVEGVQVKIPEGWKIDDYGLLQGEFHGEKSRYASVLLKRDGAEYAEWVYIDREGNVHLREELFPEYPALGHFYNGRAAVLIHSDEERKNKLGYIDNDGNMVIPPVYDILENTADGHAFYGDFYDDYAYVFKDVDSRGKAVTTGTYTGRYAKIDADGNLIEDWSEPVSLLEGATGSWKDVIELPWAKEHGIVNPLDNQVFYLGYGEYDNIFLDIKHSSFACEGGTDAVILRTYDGLLVVDLDQFTSKNQSTVKLTDWRSLDNGHSVTGYLHNDTSKTDTSIYALVFVDTHENGPDYHKCYDTEAIAEVHFLGSVTLMPHTRQEFNFHTLRSGDSVLSGGSKSIIVKFDNIEEWEALQTGIPYLDRNDADIDYVVERYEGEKWLKETFNISIDERWRTIE